MSYVLSWAQTAFDSFNEEIDFIYLKWNYNEVEKFKVLVEENLNRLVINPEIGIFNCSNNTFSFVISKQTTLFYKINPIKNEIGLIVFWNNLKNPNDLSKLL